MSFTKSFNKGRGVLAAASRLNASMENIAPAKQEKLNLSQEGIAGWLGGFLVSAGATLTTTIPFLNAGIAAGTSAAIVNLRKDINHIGKEIAKVRQQATEEAYKDGKIPEVVYKAEKAINGGDVGTVLLGALFGTIPVVNWFYNAGAVSKLQDLSKELEEKTKELKDLVAANSKPGVSQEDLDEKLEGAVDEGNEENAEGVKATDVTGSEEKQPEAAAPAAAETAPAEVQEPEVAPAPEQSEEVEETVNLDETLEEVAEVEEAGEEVAADVEKTDDLITDQETLVSLADELDEQADNGGAEPETIRAVEIAVEGIITRMQGGRRPTRVTPSLESFGGVRSKVVSTRLAAESIREWAAAAGKAIAEFFKKIIAGLSAMLGKITSMTSSLKKQISELKDTVKNSKPVQGTIKVSASLVARLKLGGKFTKDALFSGLARVKKFIATMLKIFSANKATAQGANLEAVAADVENAKFDTSALSGEIKRAGKVSEKTDEGIVTVSYLEELPGDTSVDLTGPDVVSIDGVNYRAASSLDINIENTASEEAEASVELSGLTNDELTRILDDLGYIVTSIEDIEQPVKETQGIVSKFNDWIKSAASSTKEATQTGWNAVKGFAQRVAAGASRAIAIVVRFVTSYVHSVVSFIKGIFPSNKAEAKAA